MVNDEPGASILGYDVRWWNIQPSGGIYANTYIEDTKALKA